MAVWVYVLTKGWGGEAGNSIDSEIEPALYLLVYCSGSSCEGVVCKLCTNIQYQLTSLEYYTLMINYYILLLG